MNQADKQQLEDDLKMYNHKLERTSRTINDYQFLLNQSQTLGSLEIIQKRLNLAITEKGRIEKIIETLRWLLND